MRTAVVAAMIALPAFAGAAMGATIDWLALWDYSRPAETETRLRAALERAQGDDALVLRAQIARTWSLRGRFDDADRELDAIEPLLATAGAEPRVHALLERGRTRRSAGAPEAARPLFERAVELADAAGLEGLAGDARHMLALVLPTAEAQIAAQRRLAEWARAARTPDAQRWEGPALNNLGVALNEAGRHADALAAFRDALTAYERTGKPGAIRIARWQVAHTLRRLGRADEALAMQRALAAELDAAGAPDPYVFEELALLADARGDAAEAARWRDKQRAAQEGAR